MPRRNHRNYHNEMEEIIINQAPPPPQPTPRFIIHQEPKQSIFVSDYLKNNTYDMMKELNKKDECSICMEDVLCCKKCFTVLNCGHMFHLGCIIRCPSCPICRTGSQPNTLHD